MNRTSLIDHLTTLLVAFVIGLLVAVGLHGCSGTREYTAPEQAIMGIHGGAHGLALADGIVATRCGVSSPAPVCDGFVRAYAISRVSLHLAEIAAEQWKRSGSVADECRFSEALRYASADMDGALLLLDALHLAPPPEAESSARTIAALIAAHAPACSSPDGGVSNG